MLAGVSVGRWIKLGEGMPSFSDAEEKILFLISRVICESRDSGTVLYLFNMSMIRMARYFLYAMMVSVAPSCR